MTDMPVHQAFAAVMADIPVIAKADRNRDQGYNFRGIDAVLDEVGPALRKHGVMIIPSASTIESERYSSKSGAFMRGVTVKMVYTVVGPMGDSFAGSAYGEAADSGDKAVSKAQSVAYRVFLIQALSIPTGEPDPDSESHERAADPRVEARVELGRLCKSLKLDPAIVGKRFLSDYGVSVMSADAETITGFAAIIRDESKPKPAAQDAAAEAVPNA